MLMMVREYTFSGEAKMKVYNTRETPPRGKGNVLAYSANAQDWRVVNWQYVWKNPEVYPRWQPTPAFKWVRAADERTD